MPEKKILQGQREREREAETDKVYRMLIHLNVKYRFAEFENNRIVSLHCARLVKFTFGNQKEIEERLPSIIIIRIVYLLNPIDSLDVEFIPCSLGTRNALSAD